MQRGNNFISISTGRNVAGDKFFFLVPLDQGRGSSIFVQPADAPKARGEDSDSEMSRLCQQGDLRHAGSTTVGSRLHGYVAREGEVDSNTVNFIRDPTLPESCSKIVQDLDLEENA